MKPLRFRIYATLLDGFQNYLSSSEIYQQYWGFSDNPKKTEEEFEQEQFQGLIDRINRVPFENEAADKGTVFNEIVDCVIHKREPSKESGMAFMSDKANEIIRASFKEYDFTFPRRICLEFANYYKGAISQEKTSALLETRYGAVELYGYIDELLPDKVCDIKTTGKYNAFKFKNNWQHVVYPYCLTQSGNEVYDFEYNITDFRNIWTETYRYVPERDIPKLTEFAEQFIEFLAQNINLIHDKKIFNQL